MNNGLSESRDSKALFQSQRRDSYSPLSNGSQQHIRRRSSLKRQDASALNLSNEASLMRSLSPSIQERQATNHNESQHKRYHSSLSPQPITLTYSQKKGILSADNNSFNSANAHMSAPQNSKITNKAAKESAFRKYQS